MLSLDGPSARPLVEVGMRTGRGEDEGLLQLITSALLTARGFHER